MGLGMPGSWLVSLRRSFALANTVSHALLEQLFQGTARLV